ncbi:hypothetical protein [Microbacterium suaedae]|uniref:hypothetical protein n=1 Tax=Microbacterium suaedae TaxID=2067813 RepID=UPI000DA1B641|nr:hypothetical protein [Microbacterium suaedae]
MSDTRWDPLFEDLEQQFTAEREARHGQLSAETERVRVSRLSLRDRLVAVGSGARVVVDDCAGGTHRLSVEAVGADWMAGAEEGVPGLLVLRLGAIDGLVFEADDRRRSLGEHTEDPLRARMGIGFVLRALARRRAAVTLGLLRGGRVAGTPTCAGADHVDIAIHDAGAAPRGSDVDRVRTITFGAISWVRTTSRRDVGTL